MNNNRISLRETLNTPASSPVFQAARQGKSSVSVSDETTRMLALLSIRLQEQGIKTNKTELIAAMTAYFADPKRELEMMYHSRK